MACFRLRRGPAVVGRPPGVDRGLGSNGGHRGVECMDVGGVRAKETASLSLGISLALDEVDATLAMRRAGGSLISGDLHAHYRASGPAGWRPVHPRLRIPGGHRC